MERDQREKKRERIVRAAQSVLLPLLMSALLGACAISPKVIYDTDETVSEADIGFSAAGVGSYDSADTAILMEKNTDDSSVTLWNRTVGKTYTLTYDGTTYFYDKYGESLSLGQITPGEIVEVTFLKSKKHLTSLKISPEIWNLEKVTSFEIDTVRGEATVGQEAKKLKITDNTKYFSEGKSIDVTELNPVDTVTFQGIDSEVLVVKLERGHGYLRLSGDQNFIGGWIEIGQSDIRRITEDMLIPVAVGSYPVLISKDGNVGEKSVEIRRNEETVLDISDLVVEEPEEGQVLFSLTPASAELFVDGERIDASMPVTLVYGIHQLIARADGYQTLTLYVRVGQPSAGLDITLDPVKSPEKDESSSSQTGSSSAQDGDDTQESESSQEESSSESGESQSQQDEDADSYKVYIEAPEGAEVYLDGDYVGVCPCSFKKVPGSHVVTLRKKGYVPKSYTLQLKDDKKDASYSFAELEEMGMISTERAPGISRTIEGKRRQRPSFLSKIGIRCNKNVTKMGKNLDKHA